MGSTQVKTRKNDIVFDHFIVDDWEILCNCLPCPFPRHVTTHDFQFRHAPTRLFSPHFKGRKMDSHGDFLQSPDLTDVPHPIIRGNIKKDCPSTVLPSTDHFMPCRPIALQIPILYPCRMMPVFQPVNKSSNSQVVIPIVSSRDLLIVTSSMRHKTSNVVSRITQPVALDSF